MIWKIQSLPQNHHSPPPPPQKSKINPQSLYSESTSQRLTALALPQRRQSLMITAFQVWLSASGKTNRAGARGLPAGWLFSTDTAQEKLSMWWLLLAPHKEWNGSKEALRLSHRDSCGGISTVTSLGLALKCHWFIKPCKAGNFSLFTETIDSAEQNVLSELQPVTKHISMLVPTVCLHQFKSTAGPFSSTYLHILFYYHYDAVFRWPISSFMTPHWSCKRGKHNLQVAWRFSGSVYFSCVWSLPPLLHSVTWRGPRK